MMITYPLYWQRIGQPVRPSDIEHQIILTLQELKCNNIAFSGGVDSTYILFHLQNIYKQVNAFTVGFSESHPDVVSARSVASTFKGITHHVYIPSADDIKQAQRPKDLGGDVAVRLLFRFVASKGIDRIICCDGIDEYACGYYAHQEVPTEETYYRFIRELLPLHLHPLNKNSGKVDVLLPYLDPKLVSLLSQMPMSDKVDHSSRKKIIYQLAEGKVPDSVISRRKYGFCAALENIELAQ